MAKFYVQSGSLREVISSADAHRAALWAIQRAMEPILPDDSLEPNDIPRSPNRFVSLGTSIQLSEVGFDQPQAIQFDTFEMFREWNDLVRAIDQLAGLM